MKRDDSSLDSEQYRIVSEAAHDLLRKSSAWGRIPTPVDDLIAAAELKVAPLNAFDEKSMLRYLKQVGETAKNFLLQAVDKLMGILDVHGNVIHVDPSVSKAKQTFIKLHETGHKKIPHQGGIYRWIQDGNKNLAPEVAELFEREANTFASITLFQGDAFAKVAADSAFGIKTPLNTARKFGASAYAGVREYVRTNSRACAVIVLEPTTTSPIEGPKASVRRIEVSSQFRTKFGAFSAPDAITINDDLMRFIPLGHKRMSSPQSFSYKDLNGEKHEFIGEGFRTPYNTFILIHASATMKKSVQVPRIILP